MWRQIIWQRSGGYWMFYSGLAYFSLGMYCIFVNDSVPVWLAQIAWITLLCLPFAIPPLGRWLNMNITWDRNMFDFFKSRKEREAEYNNVVKFPAPVPNVEPPVEPEKPAKIFYRIGVTDQNRVSFSMDYSEITMTKLGVQNMIEQLAVFRDQLHDEEEQ
jgi:hypothetical protein